MKRSPIKRMNAKRRKRLRTQQFGDDGYREYVISLPCDGCGSRPVDPAHVLGTRATGHGPEGLAPLCRRCHRAYDSSMTDDRIMAVHGWLRSSIRERATARRSEWEASR